MMHRTRSSDEDQYSRPVKENQVVLIDSPAAPVKSRLQNITNTIRMSAEPGDASAGNSSCEPPHKKQRPNTSPPEVVAFEKLRLVLGRHYFDVCRRLVLDNMPRCVRNVTECAQQHANKRSPRTKRVGEMRLNLTLEQISEHQPDQFVEFLYQALMRNEFIGSELFVAGIQLILTINRPSTELQVDYDVPSIVSGSSDVLERCLERFPPCRWDLRPVYKSIVLGRLDAACFTKCDREEGLFRNIIHLLEHLIETDDPKPTYTNQRKGGRGIVMCAQSKEDDPFCSSYNSWVSQNRQIYDFDKLSRSERFERLFIALRIMVKMLEMDLALWILRHPTKTRQNLYHSSRCPLIARLLWEKDYGSVNLFVKKLFQMFINMIALRYPSENIVIFSRLINLVAIAVNLSEFQHSDGMLQYPCLKSNSDYFAKQLWKALETSPHFSVDTCLDTIQHLRTPFLLLSVSGELIRKLNRHNHPTNVRGFFQHLLARRWEDCGVEKRIERGPPVDSSDPYPTLNQKKTRPKSSEIDQQQYVNLLFVGFRAYCEMYQIPAYFRAIMVQSIEPGLVRAVEASPALHTFAGTPDALERYIREHAKSRVLGSTRIVAEDVVDERMIFQGVSVDGELLLEYREDIKYLMLIEQQLKKLNTLEEKNLFNKWITFLSEIDPSLKLSAT